MDLFLGLEATELTPETFAVVDGDPNSRYEEMSGTGFGISKSGARVPATICERIERTNDLLVFDQICEKRINILAFFSNKFCR